MFTATNQIENAYENGFAYYLSSVLYQAFDNNYNNAFVAIKSSKRLLPNNPYVEQKLTKKSNVDLMVPNFIQKAMVA